MQTTISDKTLHEQVSGFVEALQLKCGHNLQSVVLYGGVAKNDYTAGKSNVNLLFIFESVNLDTLDSLSLLFQKGMADFRLSPFILTRSEVVPSSDVFAVKLFDIQKCHKLLQGQDLISSLTFSNAHLRFIAGQELRNYLARMKFFYIQNFNQHDHLLAKVQKGLTTLVINANVFLHLKRSLYFKTRKEIIEQILQEPEMDKEILRRLLTVKEGRGELSPDIIRNAYDDLMVQYKQLIKAFKQLNTDGHF